MVFKVYQYDRIGPITHAKKGSISDSLALLRGILGGSSPHFAVIHSYASCRVPLRQCELRTVAVWLPVLSLRSNT